MPKRENENDARASVGCERCEQLDARIHELELERSDLRLALARERERANALRLAYPAVHPSPLQASVPGGRAPLRHRLVDALNDSLKHRFPDIHRAAKDAGSSVLTRFR
ncbi:hypothetical protein POL68_07505 [Stigmatella sp. ncwal1]|uniref:Transposase n=1 Tax=Stigmatella ashevillensis TaxID=2995309 RepID=A0ABT5D3R4_9BACT|nr:hypothetical protein [Stigmatella ashevillena]MDC0708314.1 hypothetical protein [Stigmatella ashevillena]